MFRYDACPRPDHRMCRRGCARLQPVATEAAACLRALKQRGWPVLAALMFVDTSHGVRRLMCNHISAKGELQVLHAKPRGQELRGGDAKVSNTLTDERT